MRDEEGSPRELQFLRTRAGSTQEQFGGTQRNLLASAYDPLVLGSIPRGHINVFLNLQRSTQFRS